MVFKNVAGYRIDTKCVQLLDFLGVKRIARYFGDISGSIRFSRQVQNV